jgi:DNA (cytosine-5)-methyltransferase 1
MSLGFAEAGIKPTLATDIDVDACATYRTNLDVDAIEADLAEPSERLLREFDRVHDVFALIGGPPCQGFSSAGLKSGTDLRNRLIFNYLKLVDRVRPRWFLFENVEGLLTSNGGGSLADLVKEFILLGYVVRVEKVNFAGFGLPQARKRVIIIGNRLGIDFRLPRITHAFDAGKHRAVGGGAQAPTLGEALVGLGAATTARVMAPYSSDSPLSPYDELMRTGNCETGTTLHHVAVSAAASETMSKLRPGQTMKDLPSDLWHDSFRRRAYRRVKDGTPTEKRGGAPSGLKRLRADLNSLTITSAATREFIHPSENRPLTLREAARLQSFPDRFQFVGGSQSVAQQIGNAFPPLAGVLFARTLVELDGRFGSGNQVAEVRRPGKLLGYKLTEASGMSPALARAQDLLEKIGGPEPLSLLSCALEEAIG